MSTIDKDLAAALKQAKTRPMFFALVQKTPGEGTLIVTKTKVLPKSIEEAKKDLGGGQIFQGRCSGDATGQLVFETAKEPPPTLSKTLKAVISRDAGMTIKVDARRGAALTDDDDQSGPDSTGTTPVVVDKDGVRKRLAGLGEKYTKILKGPVASGPDASSLRQEFEISKSLIAKEDWAGAGKALDEMDRLIKRATVGEGLYQMGYEDGNDRFTVPPPNRRPALAKVPQFAELIHYYDEGVRAGQAAPATPTSNNGPTMGPDTMTEEQKEEGRKIDESRKELKKVLSGRDDDIPHTHDDKKPEVVNPPIEGD